METSTARLVRVEAVDDLPVLFTSVQRLADAILEQDPGTWGDLVIDARGCSPEYLGSALFNTFWQRVSEPQPRAPVRLPDAS
jgi:hypothetical protein